MRLPKRASEIFSHARGAAFCLAFVAAFQTEAQAAAGMSAIKQSLPAVRLEARRHHHWRHRYPRRGDPHELTNRHGDREIETSVKDGKLAAVESGNASSSSALRTEKEPAAKPPAIAGPPAPPERWSDAEILNAQRDCDQRLSGLHILYDRLEPLKEGACGLPYPIRLKGFDNGIAPALTFSPAPTISCKLTEALKRWYDDAVQPKAKTHLNATVVQIVDLSAYSCRTRYDDSTQSISQHAYANAIDIGEFVTAKGEHVSVLDSWNGGDERSAFLREIHDSACEIFGTTLGPEANEAHKNHFHLDMIDRRRPLCDFTPAQVRAREELKKHPVQPASASAKVPLGDAGLPGGDKTLEKKPDPQPEPQSLKANPQTKASGSEQEPRRHRRRRHSHRFTRS
jgi:hypothetical protein